MAQVGRKRRPVLVVTRSEVLDVRQLVTVVEVTTSVRGLAAEVGLEQGDFGLDEQSVVNCDGLHTVPQSLLTSYVGEVPAGVMARVCSAVTYAIGC